MTSPEIAALQQELLQMSRLEILRLYLDLEPDDPRYDVVDTMVRDRQLNRQVALQR